MQTEEKIDLYESGPSGNLMPTAEALRGTQVVLAQSENDLALNAAHTLSICIPPVSEDLFGLMRPTPPFRRAKYRNTYIHPRIVRDESYLTYLLGKILDIVPNLKEVEIISPFFNSADALTVATRLKRLEILYLHVPYTYELIQSIDTAMLPGFRGIVFVKYPLGKRCEILASPDKLNTTSMKRYFNIVELPEQEQLIYSADNDEETDGKSNYHQ